MNRNTRSSMTIGSFKAATLFIAFLLISTVAYADTPAPSPTSPDEASRLERGEQVRKILEATQDQARQNSGLWPDHPASVPDAGPALIYFKPRKMVDPNSDITPTPQIRIAQALARATVVLYERPEENPDGVWVGFADGHLEFAPDPTALAACKNQIEIARRATLINEDYIAQAATRPAATARSYNISAELILKILDPQNQPVVSALVGSIANFGDAYPGFPTVNFLSGSPPRFAEVIPISDRQGLATLESSIVFNYRFADEPCVPIIVLDRRNRLMSIESVHPWEFGAAKIREVHLQPACTVKGTVTSVGLRQFHRTIDWSNCTALFEAGFFNFNTIESTNNGPYFTFLLPPGDYDFWAYGGDGATVHHYARIAPGRHDLNFQIDFEPRPAVVSQLHGAPSIELRGIKAWKNSPPIKLADLRGKIVILDFWGYWCGYCVESMPYLMQIYDEFRDKGLSVIAIHDNSVSSIQEMDQKLNKTRQQLWHGRDLPFPVALDGGPTTAAYGITDFPTTYVIGRDGKLIESIDLRNPHARDEIARLLKSNDRSVPIQSTSHPHN